MIKGLPVLAKCKSADSKILYIAVGGIVDKDGEPILRKSS